MARSVTLGNGSILVGLDNRGLVRDFYYPFVGFSNHISGAAGNFVHRVGVFVDGELSWLTDPEWQVTVGSPAGLVQGIVHAVNDRLQITLTSTDVVHNEHNVFLRHVTVGNEASEKREIKLFFAQQFRIGESRRGDTGLFDPRVNAIIHYKGRTTFLVNASSGGKRFDQFNIGLFGIEGKEGTYCDAADGILEGNPIEHGSVDSVIGLTLAVKAGSYAEADYWIAVGETMAEVHDLNAYVLKESVERLTASTDSYWRAWVDKEGFDLSPLTPEIRDLYQRSLTTIRVHTDNHGGIIASSDTDMLHHGRDTYSYVWPRDAAIVAHALDVAGYSDVSRRFFEFITARLERGGYLMHKYCADGTLGSSWHPWLIEGQPEFPIQEDETALTLCMLHAHYELDRDLEFIESVYDSFIEPAANFMVEFIESRFGLPQNSFDLWEEKFGIHTYTASAVYGALHSATAFAQLLGKEEPARTYSAVAQRLHSAILEHLFDTEQGIFIKLIRAREQGEDSRDYTVDMSSFFGPLYFGVVAPDDERVERMFTAVQAKLKVESASEGYIRYEGDNYYKMREANSPNPWIVTTLWVAQYYIMKAKKPADLTRAYDILTWTTEHATTAGVLAEQMHPDTGEHLSTSPLVWSHAEFVLTVHAYLTKRAELSSSKR